MAILKVPILKAGKDASLDVDTDAIPQDMYALVVLEGLKAILNTRMSKVGAVTKLEGAELVKAHDLAMKIASDNAVKLMAGELKAKSSKSKSDVPREVQTEARRIARELVKNELRKANIKPSHVAAADITKAADAMIASDATILDQARANLANRGNIKSTVDLAALGIHESPKLVAKAKEAADAKKKDKPLSAKQAGLVKPRAKPVAAHVAH